MEWIPGNAHLGEMPSFSHLKRRIHQQIRWGATDLLVGLGLHEIPYSTGGRILVYHGIDQQGNTKINGRFIGQRAFENHLKLLSRYFKVISLHELLSGRRYPEKATVALTFDDGYQNNFEFALPLLEKYQMPATFFITAVGLRNERILWPDLLDLIAYTRKDSLVLDKQTFLRNRKRQFVEADTGTPLKRMFKSVSPEKFELLLHDLQQEAAFKEQPQLDPYWKLMNATTLRELNRSPLVTIGAHGLSHQSLPNLTPEEWRKELASPKAWLEEVLQEPVVDFAYPDGDYTPEMLKATLETGYKYQLLADSKYGESEEELKKLGAFQRLGINPYISKHNQMMAIVRGRYT